MSGRMLLARRTLIASAAGTLVFAPWIGRAQAQVAPVASDQTADALFRELDERIEAAMARYHVPGVAVGVFWQGHEHLKGFGVTNVDHPLPVVPKLASALHQILPVRSIIRPIVRKRGF